MPTNTRTPRPSALVTGAGRSTASARDRAAARDDGWDLALSYWRPPDAQTSEAGDPEALADLARGKGATVVLLPGDLTEAAEPERLVAAAVEALGRLSGLVLSHAESRDSAILDTTVESFDRHMIVNARASWQLIAAFARQAGDQGGGSSR